LVRWWVGVGRVRRWVMMAVMVVVLLLFLLLSRHG
jgi:hypothetical protein